MNMISNRLLPPSASDVDLARASGQALLQFSTSTSPVTLKVTDAQREVPIEVPVGAIALLQNILATMAAGKGLTLIPEHAELTTVQAADVLNISRPHLTKLLKENQIPCHMVGTHRRVLMEDVMAYKQRKDEARAKALDALVADAQAQGMGY